MPAVVFSVKELMSDRIQSVHPDATVAEALSKMQEHGIHEMPLMVDATLQGWVSYRSLLRHGGVTPHAKVATVSEQPVRVQPDADLFEVAGLLIANNMGAASVVDRHGKLVGVLSRSDLLKAAAEIPEIADLPLESVMNVDLETVEEGEPIDRALHRLRNLRIRQLLVVDASGRLTGLAKLDDLLRAHLAGHAGDGPRMDGGGDRHGPAVEIKSFVSPSPTVAPEARLRDAIRLMQRAGTNCVVVAEDGFARGVVSRSNVVERLARLRTPPGALCQIVGLSDHADASTLDGIYDLAGHTIKKISTEVRPEFLTLHYKVYKAKAEGDSKYSLSVHLSTQQRFLVQKADAWDPIEATRAALDSLERRVLNLKELRLERRKTAPRRSATFYTATGD